MWSKKEADTSIRGLPFYVRRQTFSRADSRQKAEYIGAVVVVIAMLCIIFRFSAADAIHSSHLSEGVCIRLVREVSAIFPEQFPEEKMVKMAEVVEFPVRKCAHFTEYAMLGITVNLYLWMCYRMEVLSDRKKKETERLPLKSGRQKNAKQEVAIQEVKGAKPEGKDIESKGTISIGSFFIRAELFCAVYACSDEIHQYFVPGRNCRFFDVCVDSAGALCGALLFWGIFRLRERKR